MQLEFTAMQPHQSPSHHPHHPHLEVHVAPPPFYKRPSIIIPAVVTVLLSGSLWSYSQNPNWLSESREDNPWIEHILKLNPNLSRADLEQDAESGDLSFWFGRSGSDYTGSGEKPVNLNESDEPSLLDQFMESQNAEEVREDANNPFFSPPPAEADPADGTATNSPTATPTPSALETALKANNPTPPPTSPLQDALNRLNPPSTSTEAAASNGNGQPSRYENPNNQGLNNPVSNPSHSGTMGNLNPDGTLAPTPPPSRTSRNATSTPTVVPMPAPTGRRDTPTVPTVQPQAQTPVSSNQRREQPLNAANQPQSYQRVGGGEMNTFADPLGNQR
ncbi:hypothetical protein VB712_14530 [Spirulina sp. CCNP1310]|uniref:hypothetical protein n=1 Tax=Spirulina sp. CCNP1310 TaxID=3110249 RepID=UPI002B1FBDB6|nr:hypothetical protein [Spirulina sp. CCNP1310]MEA5420445.1 hypothetical protein [Spirulina sp. CCNP1310]